MRLIDKQVKANPETFAPELVVTVALPLQTEDEPTVHKTFEEWGKEFLRLIGSKTKE
jgi:hypothetical protein